MTNVGRIANIEWLRIAAMIAVVLIHIDACYTYSILPATRFAVPLFFMVTGYFMGDQSKKRHWKKYIINAFRVLIGATAFYGMVEIAGSIYNHTNMLEWPWGKIFVRWILFNVNPFHYHLWFLGAYLYVLCIAAIVDKFHIWKYMYWLIIPLFIARFGLQCLDIPSYVTRNFMFIGLPCFMLGSWLKNNRSKYESLIQCHRMIIPCILLFACLPFIEDYLLGHYFGVQYGDFSSSYLLAALLLIAAVELPQFSPRYVPRNTRNIVLGVYVFHPFIHFIYKHIPYTADLVSANTWSAPVIVFVTTWILCAIILKGFYLLQRNNYDPRYD